MTIFIVARNPREIALSLDDKTLATQIIKVARVLFNAHYFLSEGDYKKNYSTPLPLSNKKSIVKWAKWTRECKENYLWMCELGIACDWELSYRKDFKKLDKKYHDFFEYWARENIPDLPSIEKISPFPLIFPEKYFSGSTSTKPEDIYLSYRNYYQAKLKNYVKKHKHYDFPRWTGGEKPDWLSL